MGGRQAGLGADFEYLWLDGSGFQRVASVRAESLTEPAAGAATRLTYAASRIDDVDPRFGFLAGWRHLIDVSAAQTRGTGRLRYGATLEVTGARTCGPAASSSVIHPRT